MLLIRLIGHLALRIADYSYYYKGIKYNFLKLHNDKCVIFTH